MNQKPSQRFDRGEVARKLERIDRVILVGSGKGGVGKSFIAASLALTLASLGHRTGILDLDVHGSSVPEYIGVRPPLETTAGGLKPKIKNGVEVMSLGLFTGNRPVPLRGGSKETLLGQMFVLTDWGYLEYLVVDLPPSTGDEVMSAFEMFAAKSILILVTIPSPLAIRVVSRLRQLARSEGIAVKGTVVNMAYLRRGSGKTYPFGKPNTPSLERVLGSEIIAEVPLDPRVSSERLARVLATESELAAIFRKLASKVETSRG